MTAVPPPPPTNPGMPMATPGMNPSEVKNSLGVWALVLGIISIVCSLGLLAGIPAMILGKKSKQAAAQGLANNGGLGQAGFILGLIGTILVTLVVVFYVVVVAAAVTTSTTY